MKRNASAKRCSERRISRAQDFPSNAESQLLIGLDHLVTNHLGEMKPSFSMI